MKIKEVEVKEGAIFIADSHYKKGDKKFLALLNNLNKNPPPQLFLLGDIFHLLLPFKFLYQYNKEAIKIINELSKKTEVYYTYGNHDFCIDKIFPDIVFADAFIDKEKSVYITHGDLDTESLNYKSYSLFIRNKFILSTINLISLNFLNNWLFKKILNKKVKCKNFKKEISLKRNYKYVIIGHYHTFSQVNNISVLASFYCKSKFYELKIRKEIEIEELVF